MTRRDTETILILEPEILIRHPLAQYLRECGYKVVETSCAAEARQVLDSRETRVDVLFASGSDGDSGGVALRDWLRERRPNVQFLVADALRAATETAARLCEDGPAATRPYEHRFVYDRIRSLLAARDRAEA